jgi:hypothetical protein
MICQISFNSYGKVIQNKIIMLEAVLQLFFWTLVVLSFIARADDNMIKIANYFDFIYMVSILRLIELIDYLDGFMIYKLISAILKPLAKPFLVLLFSFYLVAYIF